jgi:hypothetical protein
MMQITEMGFLDWIPRHKLYKTHFFKPNMLLDLF